MTTSTKIKSPALVESIERFDLSERIQHIIMMLSFTALALTGLPQSFASTGWAKAWMGVFGGIGGIRKVHHFAAVLMVFVFVYHAIIMFADLFRKDTKRWMLPTLQDAKDALQSVKYLLGKTPEPPQFGRFDWRQKIEYWSLIWGYRDDGCYRPGPDVPHLLQQVHPRRIDLRRQSRPWPGSIAGSRRYCELAYVPCSFRPRHLPHRYRHLHRPDQHRTHERRTSPGIRSLAGRAAESC